MEEAEPRRLRFFLSEAFLSEALESDAGGFDEGFDDVGGAIVLQKQHGHQ